MTENEALKQIERHIQFLSDNWKPHPDYNVIEALREGLIALEEIQKYRAIGTVEECEKYKRSCIVGVVKFDKEQLQSIVDEKVKDIELDIQEIRNRAIDEFSKIAIEEFTKFDLEHGYPTITYVKTIVRDVSEKMKEVDHGKTETKSPAGA